MAKGNRVTTPKGIVKYPSLFKPDKFGKYTANLILDSDAAKPLMAKIDQAYEENVEAVKQEKKKSKIKQADKPYADELDEDENPTGRIIFKIGKKAETAKGKPVAPPIVVDAKNERITKNVQVWGGSTIKASIDLNPYYTPSLGAGISLKLVGVQVINLVNGIDTVDSLGFDEEEDGYVFDNETQEESSDGSEDNEDQDSDEDDGEEDEDF